jgi:arsenite methyltransferase
MPVKIWNKKIAVNFFILIYRIFTIIQTQEKTMSMTSTSSQYFEKVAGEWDNLRSGYFSEEVRSAAIAKSSLGPEMGVADVGSGTGFIAAGLAPIVHKVISLDGSPAMLEVARKNLSQFDNIEYHLAESQSLPLPDCSVDAAFANMYLHHCPDPLAAIREMVRILKPGGRLVITDADTHTHTWMREEMADIWLGFDRDQIRDWYKEAELVNTIVDCTEQNCCAESSNPNITEEKDCSASISVFVATGTKRIKMRDQVRAAYGSLAQTGCGCGSSSSQASSSSCCGGDSEPASDKAPSVYYSTQDLSNAPRESGEFSLGCGNPIAMANLKPGETVLDIGSGGGLDSFLAAGKVAPTGKVIGVDMTPAMLERARKTAIHTHIDNVEFRQGEAEHLPVENDSVDVILSNCVINLTEDKGQVFREAFRVLKPGGRLEVSDIVTDIAIPVEVRLNPSQWAECVVGALPEQEYLDLIGQAGFENAKIRKQTDAGGRAGIRFYSDTVYAVKPATSGLQSGGCGCK